MSDGCSDHGDHVVVVSVGSSDYGGDRGCCVCGRSDGDDGEAERAISQAADHRGVWAFSRRTVWLKSIDTHELHNVVFEES